MDESLIEEFLVEADEMFTDAENGLLNIDRGEDFESNYNSIFRSLHSLKGAAGMFGLEVLQAHMHKLEELFTKSHSKSELSKERIDIFLSALDHARKILGGEESEYDFSTVESKPAPIQKKQIKAKSGDKIAIIDDEVMILDLLKDILEDENYEVVSYTDGNKFLEELENLDVDIVLSDMQMPTISGLDILKKTKEMGIDVPFIFLSGFLTKEIVMKGISSGADGFLEKPYDEAKVLSMLSIVLEKNRTYKLLIKSIDYILYQFSDLDNFLKEAGKDHLRKSLKTDLENILEQKKKLKKRAS